MSDFADSSTIVISKVEKGIESRPVCITHYVVISDNFAWHLAVNGKQLFSTDEPLSDLPSTMSCLQDVLHVIKHVDALSTCIGNGDKKFLPLVTARKGVFQNQAGMFIIIIFVHIAT